MKECKSILPQLLDAKTLTYYIWKRNRRVPPAATAHHFKPLALSNAEDKYSLARDIYLEGRWLLICVMRGLSLIISRHTRRWYPLLEGKYRHFATSTDCVVITIALWDALPEEGRYAPHWYMDTHVTLLRKEMWWYIPTSLTFECQHLELYHFMAFLVHLQRCVASRIPNPS